MVHDGGGFCQHLNTYTPRPGLDQLSTTPYTTAIEKPEIPVWRIPRDNLSDFVSIRQFNPIAYRKIRSWEDFLPGGPIGERDQVRAVALFEPHSVRRQYLLDAR